MDEAAWEGIGDQVGECGGGVMEEADVRARAAQVLGVSPDSLMVFSRVDDPYDFVVSRSILEEMEKMFEEPDEPVIVEGSCSA